jgi:hypothetical protein
MRSECFRFGEAVFIDLDAEPFGHFDRVFRRFETNGQNHHFKFFFDDLP